MMKIEIEKDFPQYFKPAYPEEFELFSHFEVTAGIPTVLFAVTTWKENGKPNVCFHSWSCFHGDKTAFFAVMGNLYQHTHTYANIQREKCFCIRKILGLPKSSVDDALELVGLTEFRKRLAKKYSLGMKQRLGLAGALIGRPPILILDEPTNGLDPVGIHEIRTLIRSLPQKYDCTVLVSSHLLPEVELMADDIGILNHGHLLFEGTKEELKTSARAAGFPTDNLEDTFLAMIDEDNRRRGGTV